MRYPRNKGGIEGVDETDQTKAEEFSAAKGAQKFLKKGLQSIASSSAVSRTVYRQYYTNAFPY